MELEISPEPTPGEREALLQALRELLARDPLPAAYRSTWRAQGIRENLEEADEEF